VGSWPQGFLPWGHSIRVLRIDPVESVFPGKLPLRGVKSAASRRGAALAGLHSRFHGNDGAARISVRNNPMTEFWSVGQTVFFNKSLLRTFLLHDKKVPKKRALAAWPAGYPANALSRGVAATGLPALGPLNPRPAD